jgi:predicted ATPase
LDDERRMFPALSGLAAKSLLRAELPSALALASELRGIAKRSGDPFLLLWSSMSLGSACFYSGEVERSLRVLEEGLRGARGLTVGAQREHYAGDPAIDCRLQMSLALWMTGRPAAAFDAIGEAKRQARAANLGMSLGYAGAVEGILRFFEGDTTRAARCATEVMGLAAAHPLPLWSGFARVVHGWTTTRNGSIEPGLAEIDDGIAEVRATGARLGETFLLAAWADALRCAGHHERALAIIDDALAGRRESGEHCLDAELLRVRGEMLLTLDPLRTLEAEACFRRARAIARRQRTRAWERRAAASLAALWAARGETERAARLLQSSPRPARAVRRTPSRRTT